MTSREINLVRDVLFLMIASALVVTLFNADRSETYEITVIDPEAPSAQLSRPKLLVYGLEVGMSLQEVREVSNLNGWSVSRVDEHFILLSPDFIPLQHQMGDQIRVDFREQKISGIDLSSAQCADISIDGKRIYGFKSNSILAVFEELGKPQSVSFTDGGWPVYTWSRWNLRITEAPYQRTISRIQIANSLYALTD